MNNKKTRVSHRAILPLLFCSAAVLAGDGGVDAPYGQIPSASQNALTLENNDATASASCDSGDPSRGDCPSLPEAATTPAAQTPDTMKQAQQLGQESDGFIDDAQATSAPGINTGYVGGKTRIGIGIDSQFKGKADLSHVFTETEDTAVIGQGYIGVDPRKNAPNGHVTGAGAKLNYHWVSKDESGQTSHVNKVFGAYDQNGTGDKDGKQAKKLTVGYGQERENMFWSGSVMKGLSDKFDTGQKDANGNTIYEKAYDWGVGGRVGTFISEQQMRVQGGLDYEWGKEKAANESKAKQVTLTGSVEKFFPDTPHSVNANIDVYKKSGGYVDDEQKTEVRGGVGYRYDLASEAGIWQADKMYRRVRTEIPGEEIKRPPKVERKLVKHTMELEADSFFKVDSAKLTPEAQKRLESVVAKLRECGPEGNIRITGNTCDIGSTQHNQKLSERRAKSVKEFMIKHGIPSDILITQGLGESSPKYPNTDAERHKNRRVDVEYVCYQNEYKDQVVQEGGTTKTDPKVVWKQELIPTPPLWVRQALHNTADHKQRVDTYKTTAGNDGNQSCTIATTANNDSGAGYDDIEYNSDQNILDVTVNDTACDKDSIVIVDVQKISDQGGTVEISADGKSVIYTPKTGFSGTDTFTYTIKDKNGKTSTATVTVVVKPDGGACSAPKANNDGTFDVKTGDKITTLMDNDTICDNSDTKIDSASCTIGGSGAKQQTGILLGSDGKSIVFDSAAGRSGTEQCEYTIIDKNGNTSTATFTINFESCGSASSSDCSCPTELAKTASLTYQYKSSVLADPVYINDLTTFTDGKTITGVSLSASSTVTSTTFYAHGIRAGEIYVEGTGNSSKIKFQPVTNGYCAPDTFKIYITVEGCSTPIEVTVTATSVAG